MITRILDLNSGEDSFKKYIFPTQIITSTTDNAHICLNLSLALMKPWQVELEGGWWLWFKLLKTNVTLFGSPETGEGLYTGGFGVGWLSWKLAVCIALHKCAINVFSHLFLSGQSCLKKCVSQDKKNVLQGKLRQGLTLGDSNPKNAQDYRSNLKACCTWTTAVSSPCWSALALVIG